MDNIIKHTASHLSETEAAQRAEDLRQRQHMIYGMGCGASCQKFPQAQVEFRKDWARMFEREGQGSID